MSITTFLTNCDYFLIFDTKPCTAEILNTPQQITLVVQFDKGIN